MWCMGDCSVRNQRTRSMTTIVRARASRGAEEEAKEPVRCSFFATPTVRRAHGVFSWTALLEPVPSEKETGSPAARAMGTAARPTRRTRRTRQRATEECLEPDISSTRAHRDMSSESK